MPDARRSTFGFALLLILAIVTAYAGSLRGPFVLDDFSSLAGNPTIRRLDSLAVLRPPAGQGLTVEARPLLNLSLALNYAWGGLAVEGYHLGNILIHLCSSLVLFGLLRRTFHDPLAAFVGALLWALHPLDTAAVTYLIQRAESLMGLCYFLTLYCLTRLAQAGAARAWAAAGVLACACGMATKEVMVSAPIAVLLYDGIFFSEGVRSALRRRPLFYAGLASTWIIVLSLAAASGGRGGTSGLASGVAPFTYWITQPAAVLHYLRLVVWPSPLVFDYGTPWIQPWTDGLPQLIAVAVLAGLGLAALCRRLPAGFAVALIFLVLAPTSLVPGNRQVLAEHRMYVPLAAVAIVVAAWLAQSGGFRRRLALGMAFAAAAVLGCLTYARNEDYRSALSLYGADVAHQPQNPYALTNYATALLGAERYGEAERYARRAISVQPGLPAAHDNLGTALMHEGRPAQAEVAYRDALALNSRFTAARLNLAVALVQLGRPEEAVVEARRALEEEPGSAEIAGELGAALAAAGRPAEAEAALRRAIQGDPALTLAHLNLGILLIADNRLTDALAELETAQRLDPDNALAAASLGQARSRMGQTESAIAAYRQAIALDPRFAEAHERLGNELLREGQADEAVREYELAVSLAPAQAAFHYNLANGLLRRPGEQAGSAIRELRRALQLDPTLQPAAVLLRRLGATP